MLRCMMPHTVILKFHYDRGRLITDDMRLSDIFEIISLIILEAACDAVRQLRQCQGVRL